jgi:hypothetical protein
VGVALVAAWLNVGVGLATTGSRGCRHLSTLRVAVYYDTRSPDLPVLMRGGAIRFYRWSARRACYFADDNIGGAKRFQEDNCASLEDIHAKKWASYEPRPVRILASRFIQLDPFTIGPVYFPLKRGEFIQGLLASIRDNLRVYVVTVPAPAQYADRWPEWPRIVGVPER